MYACSRGNTNATRCRCTAQTGNADGCWFQEHQDEWMSIAVMFLQAAPVEEDEDEEGDDEKPSTSGAQGSQVLTHTHV
jgi:hypothetical protein